MPVPHEGDRRAVAAATLAAGLLIAQQVAGRTTRDAFFLSTFRVESLPLMMMASAVLALIGAEAMSVALARRSPNQVVPAVTGLSALLLLLDAEAPAEGAAALGLLHGWLNGASIAEAGREALGLVGIVGAAFASAVALHVAAL